MEPFASILTSLPWSMIEILMNVVAGLGAILLTYGVFLDAETKQDAVFTVGAGCLFVYALWLGNTILSIGLGGLMLGSFIELVEIFLGYHIPNDGIK